MVATEFLNFFSEIRGDGSVGVYDLADRLNCLYSVTIIIICVAVVTVKQYFFDPLACYTATPFKGENIDDYVKNFCWVEGTVSVPVDQQLPVTEQDWKVLEEKRLLYYQWVPFVLALQCVLFLVPRFIWQMLTYNRTGTDLENLVKMASEAAKEEPDAQQQKVQHIASSIKNMILATRDTRKGCVADFRRRCNNMLGVFAISKRLGTWIAGVYLLLKIVYLINSVGQIYMMQRFLGLHKNYTYFGAEIAKDIVSGRDWQQTEVFPRVTFCRVPIQHLGAINYQTSQCVLAINFLNEKIYIFLWFWLVLVSIFTLISIPVWYWRITSHGSRSAFIKKNLLLCNNFKGDDRNLLGPFTRRFLRCDGFFVLRMLALNAGDLVTSEVVGYLFDFYKDDFIQRDMCDDRCFSDPDQLPIHTPPRPPPLAPRAAGDATMKRGNSRPLYPPISDDSSAAEKSDTRV